MKKFFVKLFKYVNKTKNRIDKKGWVMLVIGLMKKLIGKITRV